jgi:hypothetical protein
MCWGVAAGGEGGVGRPRPNKEEEGVLRACGIERRCAGDGESPRAGGGGRSSAARAGLGFHGEDEMRPRERERRGEKDAGARVASPRGHAGPASS